MAFKSSLFLDHRRRCSPIFLAYDSFLAQIQSLFPKVLPCPVQGKIQVLPRLSPHSHWEVGYCHKLKLKNLRLQSCPCFSYSLVEISKEHHQLLAPHHYSWLSIALTLRVGRPALEELNSFHYLQVNPIALFSLR
jgi:hypothetical protein